MAARSVRAGNRLASPEAAKTNFQLHVKSPQPAVRRKGLKAYDPEAFTLLDDFYSGRVEPPAVKPLLIGK